MRNPIVRFSYSFDTWKSQGSYDSEPVRDPDSWWQSEQCFRFIIVRVLLVTACSLVQNKRSQCAFIHSSVKSPKGSNSRAVLLRDVYRICCDWRRLGVAMLQEFARPFTDPGMSWQQRPEHICVYVVSQYYLSSLLGFLIVEMFANWGGIVCPVSGVWSSWWVCAVYYRYLNAHGRGTASTVFLIVGKGSCSVFVGCC